MLSTAESENVQIAMNLEWSITCRTCLHSGETRSLFEQDIGSQLSYADKVMLCTNMDIRENDNLPDRICMGCIEELEVAYQFRTNCDTSNVILQSYLEDATEKSCQAITTLSNSENAEITEEIAIPLDSGVLYTYKPPSGLNVKLIQRTADSESILPASNARWIDDIPSCGENDPIETVDYDGNNFDEASTCESDSKVILDDLATRNPSKNVDIKMEHLQESDTVVYVYETAIEASNELEAIAAYNVTEPLKVTDTYDNFEDTSRQGILQSKVYSKSVRTLQTIRKTNKPNEVTPTIETVTTQTAADGSGIETVIRVKRNLSSVKQKHICEICNTTYKHKHALETHLRRHRGDRPYKCEHCDKAFVVPFELRRHIRTHTGHKPYKCQYCDRAYSDFGSKTKHERTHTGERPYRCEYCSKTFSYSHVLNSHLLIHTGEKKYSCSTCGKRFTKSHHLKGHQKKHLIASTKTPECFKLEAEVVNGIGEMQPKEPLSDADGVDRKVEASPTVIMMDEQSEQGLVDSFVDDSRLASTGWTLTDVGLPLSESSTGRERTSDGMTGGSVVTIGPEELENVSIVSFSDYMIKTEAIERLMMHDEVVASSSDGATAHAHGVVDSLQDFVTVLLPKSDSTLVDAGFGNMEMIDG